MALAAQTGASFGYSTSLPPIEVPRLHGRMTVAQALSQLLRGIGWRAIAVGPSVFRLTPTRPSPRQVSAKAKPPAATAQEVIVTGRKRTETLADVSAPLSVYMPDANPTRDPTLADSQQVTRAIATLSTTNAGPGTNRLFIRGVADSPFFGFNQSTVAVQVDDSRIAYDGPDPDLRLVDVERVEVLEGPQGPLYGTGALGGVYRIVTQKPVLDHTDATIGGSILAIDQGGIGGNAQAMLNLPVANDFLAVRAVGYVAEQPGWIEDTGLRTHANASHVVGQRVTARVTPGTDWTIDFAEMSQSIHASDSQYATADSEGLARQIAVTEPHSSNFRMVSAHTKGTIGTVDMDATTSMVWNDLRARYDASAVAASFGMGSPAVYDELRHYRVFDQEFRFSGHATPRLSWLAGVSYLAANSNATGTITAPDEAPRSVLDIRRDITEAALFGEGSYAFHHFKVALGGRLFSNVADDELAESDQQRRARVRFIGATPSVSLSWQPGHDMLVYVRYASAIRPGGLNPSTDGRYGADRLDNVDFGTRLTLADGMLTVDASLFRSIWKDVQSDYLLADGLIASHNVGDASSYGGEWSLGWSPLPAWRIKASGILQSARLVRTTSGQPLPEDTRLPVVPDLAANLMLSRSFDLDGWQAIVRLDAHYTGATRLSFDAGLNRQTPAYADFALGLSATRGHMTVRVGVDNLANARADTFAFGNPFSIQTTQQFTPLQPRTISVGVTFRR